MGNLTKILSLFFQNSNPNPNYLHEHVNTTHFISSPQIT